MNAAWPIGVFDSGLGGLTVLSALAKALPDESFVYLGDTARVPYGARSAHIVQRYSFEDAAFLLRQKVKMIVIACNTATAHAEDVLRNRHIDIPLVGVIQPGVDALVAQTKSKRVGVVATHSTIKSKEYVQRILKKKKDMEIFSCACPLLVPLVEEGWIEKQITRLVIQEYFSEFLREEVDTVVLGCTHYPLLKAAIQKEFPQLVLIDSSLETAKAVKQMLTTKNLTNTIASKQKNRKVSLYLTDMSTQISYIEDFLGGIHFDLLEEVQL